MHISNRILGLSVIIYLLGVSGSMASPVPYEITSKKDGKVVKYKVYFEGGWLYEQWTAFDPMSKKFVYLRWQQGQKPPEPEGLIWDHRTGKTIKLYKFPDAKMPLPIIPSLREMKYCPMTGDRHYKSRP